MARLQPVHDAGNLGHARQACQTAGKHHHQHRVAGDGDAGVPGRPRVVAGQLDLVAPLAAIEHPPDHHRRHQADEQTQVSGDPAELLELRRVVGQTGQPGRLGEHGLIWKPPSVQTAKIQKLIQARAM